jgi:hypothetical protein
MLNTRYVLHNNFLDFPPPISVTDPDQGKGTISNCIDQEFAVISLKNQSKVVNLYVAKNCVKSI